MRTGTSHRHYLMVSAGGAEALCLLAGFPLCALCVVGELPSVSIQGDLLFWLLEQEGGSRESYTHVWVGIYVS